METIIKQRGGKREGSGRKANGRSNIIFCRVGDQAMRIVKEQKNVSAFIERLILQSVGAEVSEP